jgi:hypothetical protein
VTKYVQERKEAYDDLLEAGVMGHATLTGKDTYDPQTSQTLPATPIVVNLPMVRANIPLEIRYEPDSLISERDVRLLVAALDDTGAAFDLSMEHQLSFADATYKPKSVQTTAPDGVAVMYDVIATLQ